MVPPTHFGSGLHNVAQCQVILKVGNIPCGLFLLVGVHDCTGCKSNPHCDSTLPNSSLKLSFSRARVSRICNFFLDTNLADQILLFLDWACWSAAPHLPIGVFIPACSYVQLSSVKTIRTIITVFVVPTGCNPRIIFLRIWPPHTTQSGIFDVLCFPQPWVSTHATKILYFPYGDSSGAEFACYSTACQWCGPPCYV